MLGIIALPAYSQDDDEGTDPLTEASMAMRQRQFLKAENIYRAMLVRHPDDVTVKQLLTHALINQNKFRDADSMLRRMVAEDTSNAGNYWYCGLSAERQQKDSLAITCFLTYIRKTTVQDQRNINAWLHAGSGYRRMMHVRGITADQLEKMIFYYEQYLILAETDPYAEDLRLFLAEVKTRRPAAGELLIWAE